MRMIVYAAGLSLLCFTALDAQTDKTVQTPTRQVDSPAKPIPSTAQSNPKVQRPKQCNLYEMFVRPVDKAHWPQQDAHVFPKRLDAVRNMRAEVYKLEYRLEEAEAPVYGATLKSLGLTSKEMKEILANGAKTNAAARAAFGDGYVRYLARGGVRLGGLVQVGTVQAAPGLFGRQCKQFAVSVCQNWVCVDQPIPVNVYDITADPASNGSFSSVSGSQFSYSDAAYGSSDWNLTYHRHHTVHEGAIRISANGALVETAKVRQVGVTFEPLLDTQGWPEINGVFAEGGYQPIPGTPKSRGSGAMWIEFRVTQTPPNGTSVVLTDYEELYEDKGWIDSNITQEFVYPPARALDLNQSFPAGTQFQVEVVLRYEIDGHGEGGNAWAEYNLDVKPYINLEACSWEYPGSVTVPVPD